MMNQLKKIETEIDIIIEQCKFYGFKNYVEIYQNIKKDIFSNNVT